MPRKKSKHRIKINNTVRKLFGGKPFDEGVADLSEEVLVELMLLLNVPEASLESREAMVRALRRIWSEGVYAHRKQIVAYLEGRMRSAEQSGGLPSSDASAKRSDGVERIVSLLDRFPHTRDEEQAILNRFHDAVDLSAVTPEAIETALHDLRKEQRLSRIETVLGVAFDARGCMAFYAPFRFVLRQHDFSKTLHVVSDPLELDAWLSEEDDAALLHRFEALKEELTLRRQEQIDAFVTRLLAHEHPYLTPEQIETHLRRLPPDGDWVHAPIDYMICERVVRSFEPDCRLVSIGDAYAVELDRTVRVQERTIPYRVTVQYDKALFYAMIWRGEPLPIREDLHATDEEMRDHFDRNLRTVYDDSKDLATGLEIDNVIVWKHILSFLEPQLIASNNLKIKPKTHRRILYHFGEYLRPIRQRKKREELLAKTIRDFKMLFPLARALKRRIIFHAGPTNSGKTYAAMERLRAAQTGYYLAPLRLLALEGYETLRAHGVATSLITGEEEIIDEESTHISSTIEMLNFEADVACCVIDEIQMIADRDRGWAWANALIGAPAQTVILTGSVDAIPAVREIAEYLGEPLEVVEFVRKNPLEILRTPVPLKRIKPLTAVVAFSRKEVLSLRQRLSPHHRVSVVYGNLSPEVRREEARKFREGETEILVATDAIAMGLNLPIRTLLFARDNKFDGLRRRELTTAEILQIAGRAGRYGIHEHGYVGALDAPTLETVASKFHAPLPPIELPVSVMASLHHVMLIGEILETDDLLEILSFFAQNMEFEGPFKAANIESMLEIAEIVGQYDLDLRSRYHLSTAPVAINSPYIESVFHRYLKHLEKDRPVPYLPPRALPAYAQTHEELLQAEDRVKEVSLYLWLGFRFPERFPDAQAAIKARTLLNRFIETSLSKGDFVKRCRRCGAPLDLSYRYSICERCYTRSRTGSNRRWSRRKDR
jgi:ATP-dependent RNA helicase SUPV3L1/SUV3